MFTLSPCPSCGALRKPRDRLCPTCGSTVPVGWRPSAAALALGVAVAGCVEPSAGATTEGDDDVITAFQCSSIYGCASTPTEVTTASPTATTTTTTPRPPDPGGTSSTGSTDSTNTTGSTRSTSDDATTGGTTTTGSSSSTGSSGSTGGSTDASTSESAQLHR